MITTKSQKILHSVLNSKHHFVILLLGFSSGLPAALTASTLQAWFTESGLNLQTIGAITLLVLPYSFRFLWAPLFDYFKIPGLDRRRGWLFLTQLALILAISAMALFTPEQLFKLGTWSIPWLMVVGFITAVLSTSQDIVINAYQIEILAPEERGLGSAIYSTGWRIGTLISGALALILAKELGWKETYLFMASLMSVGLIATFLAPRPPVMKQVYANFLNAAIAPLQDFFHRYGWQHQWKSSYAMYSNNNKNEYLFVEDLRSFQARVELAKRYQLEGISVWKLGLEDPAIWGNI